MTTLDKTVLAGRDWLRYIDDQPARAVLRYHGIISPAADDGRRCFVVPVGARGRPEIGIRAPYEGTRLRAPITAAEIEHLTRLLADQGEEIAAATTRGTLDGVVLLQQRAPSLYAPPPPDLPARIPDVIRPDGWDWYGAHRNTVRLPTRRSPARRPGEDA